MNFKSSLLLVAFLMLIAGSVLYPATIYAIGSDSIPVTDSIGTIVSQADTLVLSDSLTVLDSIKTDSLNTGQKNIDLKPVIENSNPANFSEKNKKAEKETDPESYHAKRAAKWAMLPGGGQIYNKRWWKVPIAWAMIGAGGYFIYSSASDMRTYNRALDLRNSGQVDEFANILTEQQIVSYRNLYRRNLQLSAFGTVGLWTLTILDAVVDAHLKTYDISDNLSIKFKPKVLRVYNNSVPSFAITLYL